MRIERRFTTTEGGAYGGLAFATTTSEIRNPDGSIVFQNDAVEVPEGWSQVASDVIAQKYFRKAGVPQRDAEGKLATDETGNPILGGERDARQVFHRLAGCWRHWGEDHGYFDSKEDAGRCIGRAHELANDSSALGLCAEYVHKHQQVALARQWMGEAEQAARNGSDLAICALSWYHIGERDEARRCQERALEMARTATELAELVEILAWSSVFRPEARVVESILGRAERAAVNLGDVLACMRAYERWNMEEHARSCLETAERRKLLLIPFTPF